MSHCLVVLGLSYKAYPDGSRRKLTNLAETKALTPQCPKGALPDV